MRLNLGCGNDLHPGFINIDCRDIEGVARHDITDADAMSAFKPASIILAYDVLEHFPRAKAREVLEMWVDLLAEGGTLKLRCPDFRHMMNLGQTDEWIELLLYGGQDYDENYHRCGFTAQMLVNILEDMGLEICSMERSLAGNIEIEAVR
jgi:predicted SAM-dependent methyltransferase